MNEEAIILGGIGMIASSIIDRIRGNKVVGFLNNKNDNGTLIWEK